MKIKLNIVKAFTQNKEQGNPAGIVFDADYLLSEHMIAITAQTGFSECAFIQKSEKADFKVRFFSAKQEVDLCGHVTIAFFSLLSSKLSFKIEKVKKFTQETRAGILSVYCYPDGLIEMEQALPKISDFKVEKDDIAKLLNIPVSSIQGQIQIVSTGSPKLIIPIDTLQSLFAICPDLNGIAEYCKYSGARGFYPFTCQTLDPNSDFHARQFNPLAGIDEDPITGIAAGALGAYLKYNGSKKTDFIIEQGHILQKFGKIFVSVKEKILVGGYATHITEQELELSIK
jgi:PhzF family phenazine biosynthesis protein